MRIEFSPLIFGALASAGQQMEIAVLSSDPMDHAGAPAHRLAD